MIIRNNKTSPQSIVHDIHHAIGKFTPDHWRQLGDADSAHGVLFGELDGIGRVAIKPHAREERAATELRNLERIRRAGFDALEPLGFATGSLATYLVTVHRGDIRHLGQMRWRANVAAKELPQVIVPTLHMAATAIAAWHNAGITHGDAQIKNVAFDKQENSVYVDAERTQFNHHGEMGIKMAHKDLKLFGTSALARGLLDDRSVTYRAGFLREALLDIYFEQANQDMDRPGIEDQKAMIEDHWTQMLSSGVMPRWALAQVESPAAK